MLDDFQTDTGPCLSLGVEMKMTLICDRCSIVEFCWHVSTSAFRYLARIWNDSAEIASCPLALLMVMLLKAAWLKHSEVSGSGEWSPWISRSGLFYWSLCSILDCVHFSPSARAWASCPHMHLEGFVQVYVNACKKTEDEEWENLLISAIDLPEGFLVLRDWGLASVILWSEFTDIMLQLRWGSREFH